MTIPASGPISIQDIRNEFYGGGGPTDLASFRNAILGRGSGVVSMSEFRGLGAWPIKSTFDLQDGAANWHIAGLNATSTYHESGSLNLWNADITAYGLSTSAVRVSFDNGGTIYTYNCTYSDAFIHTYTGPAIAVGVGTPIWIKN